MASADRAQLIAELLLDDKFTKPLNRIDKRLGAFSGAVNRNLGRGIDTAVTAVARGVVNVGKSITTAAIDWEDAFAGVRKTMDETAETSFDEISASLREMSTTMPTTAVELAAIAEAGGAMGISADDIEEFTKQVAVLGATTNLSTDEAATALGQLQNVIGLTGDEFDDFSDTLVYLGNKGSSTEDVILEITRRMGAVGKSFGLSKPQILGWAAAAANLGMEADQAGGSMQGLLTKLQPAIFKGGKTIETVFGKSAKQIRRLFEKDAGKGLQLFVQKLRKMPKEARFEAIEKLFGRDRGIRRLITGLIGDTKKLGQTLKDANTGWFESAAAQDEFNKRNATVRSAITRLRNGITDAAVTIGEGFTPALGRAAEKLAAFLKDPTNKAALKQLGTDIGKMIDGVDWSSLLGYARDFMGILKTTSDYAKTLWDGFSALPSDAKAMLVGLGGLSKLTGGAPIKIAVDFAKDSIGGIFGHFFDRGSSPANPMWVQSIAGPTGGPGTGGGTGGLLSLLGLGGMALGGAAAFAGLAELQRTAATGIAEILSGGKKATQEWLQTALDIGGSVVNPLGQLILDLPKNFQGVIDGITSLIPKDPVAGMTGQLPGAPGGGPRTAADVAKAIAGTKAATQDVGDKVGTAQGVLDRSILDARDAVHQSKQAVTQQVSTSGIGVSAATRGAGQSINTQSIGNTNRIVNGFRTIPAPIVSVDVDVSAMSVVKQTTTISRSTVIGSRSDDNYNDHR